MALFEVLADNGLEVGSVGTGGRRLGVWVAGDVDGLVSSRRGLCGALEGRGRSDT